MVEAAVVDITTDRNGCATIQRLAPDRPIPIRLRMTPLGILAQSEAVAVLEVEGAVRAGDRVRTTRLRRDCNEVPAAMLAVLCLPVRMRQQGKLRATMGQHLLSTF